jgi:hypothetical protein
MTQITEQQAKKAPAFIVDWQDPATAPMVDNIRERHFTDYGKACAFANRKAKAVGGAYLMPIIDGKKAAQWVYSMRYPRHFEA